MTELLAGRAVDGAQPAAKYAKRVGALEAPTRAPSGLFLTLHAAHPYGAPCAASSCAWRALQSPATREALQASLARTAPPAHTARRTAVAEELAAQSAGVPLQDMVPDCC